MKAKIITLFSHKGGVSKTTTTYNIAWKLTQMGKNVLLVDGDSQCNLTGLILDNNFEEYYTNPETKLDNIMDGVRVAFEGKPRPISEIQCVSPSNNPKLFLIPGHMNISEFEPSLSLALNSSNSITTLQNLPGAFYELIRLCSEKNDIDYIFIDMNPGLNALNQVFFMYSDYFIVPTNPDPFSVMALNTLSKILPKWKTWSRANSEYFSDSSYPMPQSEMKFVGTVIQRFSIRNSTASSPFVGRINEIKEFIKFELKPKLESNDMVCSIDMMADYGIELDHTLAEISEFGSLLQKSHNSKCPVFALTDVQIAERGTVLIQMTQSRDKFDEIFIKIAEVLLRVTND